MINKCSPARAGVQRPDIAWSQVSDRGNLPTTGCQPLNGTASRADNMIRDAAADRDDGNRMSESRGRARVRRAQARRATRPGCCAARRRSRSAATAANATRRVGNRPGDGLPS